MRPPQPGRPGFTEWVDRQDDPEWPALPLTHITKGILAEDILRSGEIAPSVGPGDDAPRAYFFYGRAAYRCSGEKVVKLEAACPYCFIFAPETLARACSATAFDTGAFRNRMYSHVLTDEMNEADFRISPTPQNLNRLIRAAFTSIPNYIEGSRDSVTRPSTGASAWEMAPRAFLELLSSPGRNEPDDRICSIEVMMSEPVPLDGHLIAVIAPHTHWSDEGQSPWLVTLRNSGVLVAPYVFVPGRSPDYYHALVEASVADVYRQLGFLE
jgi:hypothetical protein